MKNIKVVQASFIARKALNSPKPWLTTIEEEVRKMKRGEGNALRICK